MFGIGFQEMIVILVVALVVFGPKRLPDLAKSLGKGLAEFKKASEEVRKGIEDAAQEEEAAPAKEEYKPDDSIIYASGNPEAGLNETPGSDNPTASNTGAGSLPAGD